MAQSLSINVDEIMALTPELDDLAAYASSALERLRLTLNQAGAYWGGDETGQQFAATFNPDAQHAIRYMEDLVSSLQSQARFVRSTVSQIQAQDQLSGQQLNAANGSPAAAEQLAPTTIQSGASQPVALGEPGSAGANPVAGSVNSPAGTGSPSPSATSPSSNSPSQASQSPSDGGGRQQPGANAAEAEPGAGSQPGVVAAPTGPAPEAADRRARTGSTAATAAPDDSPWAKSSAAAAPESSSKTAGPPPNKATAATPGRPPGGRKPAESDEKTDKPDKPGKAVASKADVAPANPNAGLAAALAARHGIEVLGFDAPGVDEHTAREFAAAVDDMLAAYPTIDLRGVAIDALDENEITRTTWGRAAGTIRPTLYTSRIALALAAAVDPVGFADALADAVRAGYLTRGVETRPVYYAVVREFGHALDIAGGLRARTTAQRGLIAQYLSTVGPDPRAERLATVVDQYRLWRAQIPGAGFDGPRLDPAMALAGAFTEVQLRGGAAAPPARALHRLLVEAASTPAGG